MTLPLSREALERWTGYQRPSAQIRWLKRHGILWWPGADGYPRVPPSEFERHAEKERPTRPNFDALG